MTRHVLRIGALLLALLPATFAQLNCVSFVANQPTLRQEGVTEPAGDILITCSGNLVGALTSPQFLSVYVNQAAITSRPLDTTFSPFSIPTEAALLVNDCTTNSGFSPTHASCAPSGTFSGGNPIQGVLQTDGSLLFSNFTLPTSGTPFQLRITNLRVNVSQLASNAYLTASLLSTIGIQNSQNLVLGVVEPTLALTVPSPVTSFQQCGAKTATANLTIRELLANAFRSPASDAINATPAQWYFAGNESQTILKTTPGWKNQSGSVPGQADFATRIRINVSNIPVGVTVTFPLSVTTATGSLVANATGDLGAFSPSALATPISSSGSVTYEVRSQSQGAIDAFTLPVTISTPGNAGAGAILVSATYAPTSVETALALPIFADTSVPTPLFNVNSCQPATSLSFATQPINTATGSKLPDILVYTLDSNGSLANTSTPITLTSSPSAINQTVTSVNGIATFSGLTFSTPGAYTMAAAATGLTGVTSHSFNVQSPTTLSFFAPSSARYGQSIQLSATVSPSVATGSVTFFDGPTVLGSAPVANGVALFYTSLINSGSRKLKAVYVGSPAYLASQSTARTVAIIPISANSFLPAVTYTTGSRVFSMATADLTGDGYPDVVTANYSTNDVSILLNNGNGTFRAAVNFPVGNQPAAVVAADFNLDGNVDLAVANEGDGTITFLFGKGSGAFQPPVTYAVGPSPVALAVADFNNDGIPDLAVANATFNGGNNLRIDLGNGDGTFHLTSIFNAGNNPSSMVAADFNQDGNADVAVTDAVGGQFTILLGNGNGTLQGAFDFPTVLNPQSIAVGDFNGDGLPDIAVTSSTNSFVSVSLGTGGGGFSLPVNYTVSGNHSGIIAVDLNGDGNIDLALASVNSNSVTVLLNDGKGAFPTPLTYPAATTLQTLVAADFNNDGRVDLAAAAYNSNNISILLATTLSQLGISGRVTLPGSGLASVSIKVGSAQALTDALGNYSVTGLTAGSNYTVTPSLTGYTFFPANQTFNNLSTAQVANFNAIPSNYVAIYGQVTAAGAPLSGIIVGINGTQTLSIPTDSSGNYFLVVPQNGSYTVGAAAANFTFNGPLSFNNLTSNQIVNFTGIAAVGYSYFPVTPCRVADTRMAGGKTGAFGPPSMPAATSRSFPVPLSACGIPANAAAYSLNITAVPNGYLGFLSIWPTGQSMPVVSTLNSYNGTVVANAAIVPAGTSGSISIYVTDPSDVLFDINGYFAPSNGTNGSNFYTVTPCRIADTRTGGGKTGAFGPPSIQPRTPRAFPIPSAGCGVPSTASAYSFNLTAVPLTSYLGLLDMSPAGVPQPVTSTLNSYTGDVKANAAIIPAGTGGGAVSIWSSDLTDALFDVNGYFGAVSAGLTFYPVTPCRVADTRAGGGKGGPFGPPQLAAKTQRTLVIPASTCGIPLNAAAYSLNVTAVPTGYLGYLTLFPTGQAVPVVSTLNSYTGAVTANAAIVPAGTSGAISIYVTDAADVLFDINGYFAP